MGEGGKTSAVNFVDLPGSHLCWMLNVRGPGNNLYIWIRAIKSAEICGGGAGKGLWYAGCPGIFHCLPLLRNPVILVHIVPRTSTCTFKQYSIRLYYYSCQRFTGSKRVSFGFFCYLWIVLDTESACRSSLILQGQNYASWTNSACQSLHVSHWHILATACVSPNTIAKTFHLTDMAVM